METVIREVHTESFVERAIEGISKEGGKGARYFATDICDGIAQGHDGINYSLASRDMIANMIEIHGNATGFDAGVFIASCDKSVPASFDGDRAVESSGCGCYRRRNGSRTGSADIGTDRYVFCDVSAREISEDKFLYYKHHACPSCGACSFMGTASTMQIMAEALGLMIPGTALMPATCDELKTAAYQAGELAVKLAKSGLSARDIVTK